MTTNRRWGAGLGMAVLVTVALAARADAAAGSLDVTFGLPGRVVRPLGQLRGPGLAPYWDEVIGGTVIDGSGRIVVVGEAAFAPNHPQFAVARFTASGMPDATFGTGGTALTTVGAAGEDYSTAVALDGSGRIVVAGYAITSAAPRHCAFAVVRYLSNGILDATFGSGGKVVTPLDGLCDAASGLAIDGSGRIVVVGTVAASSKMNLGMVRYLTSGVLDPTFGVAGKVSGAITAWNDVPHGVAIDGSGRIVVVGTAENPDNPGAHDVEVARFTASGAFDSSFGSAGRVVTSVGDLDEGRAVAIDPNGRIVVAGRTLAWSPWAQDGLIVAYTASGSLDATFGSGGIVTVSGSETAARALAIDGNGRIVIVGYRAVGPGSDFAVARYTTTGTPDATFGGGGLVTTPVSNESDAAEAVALDGSGRIVVAGVAGGEHAGSLALARYTTTGALDTTFGRSGWTSTAVNEALGGTGALDDQANAVAIDAEGRLVVAGSAYDGSAAHFAVLRYAAGGVVDPTFNEPYPDSDGLLVDALGTGDDVAQAVAIDASGRIVVVGRTWDGARYVIALARYTATGARDTTFGSNGLVTTAISSTYGAGGAAVVLDGSGRIVVAGYSYTGLLQSSVAVVRYTASGALDTTFGGRGAGGKVATAVGYSAAATAVALDASGRIVVTGWSQATSGAARDVAVLRYTASGTLDVLFGSSGKVTTAVGPGSDTGYAVAIDGSGRIVIGGSASNGNNDDVAVLRYTTSGALDTTFGTGGKVTTAVGPGNDVGRALRLDDVGRIVVAGSASNGTDDDVAVLRYTTSGALDTTFGGTGKVTTALGVGADVGRALVIDGSKRLVVAGSMHNGWDLDVAVLRYLSGTGCN
jgi:uncharacterized delta-60 repeat protein